MDDLISRKAALETVKKLLYETALNSYGSHQDDEIYADIAENRIGIWIGLVPSVPAVPLDKLCEWLGTHYGSPCLLKDDCDSPCMLEGVGQMSGAECWYYLIRTKVMEGLNEAD